MRIAVITGAIGGAIGGATTFGLTSMLGPAATMLGSIAQGAGVGAASSAMSNVGVTMLTYYLDHGTLAGCGNQLLIAGISGAISGGIMGGLMGGLRFHFANKPKVTYGQKDIQNYKYNMIEDRDRWPRWITTPPKTSMEEDTTPKHSPRIPSITGREIPAAAH